MGKKLGYGIAGLILIAVIYYFTSGSTQIVERAKAQLDTELTTLQQNGFVIKERRNDAKRDHFIIRFDEPEKIAVFFTKQGNPATPEDIAVLKGLEIGADVDYLKDLYAALSIDLYPVKLPDGIIQEAGNDPENRAVLAKVEEMFRKKKLLMHIDIAKDLKHFKGRFKDINETFPTKEPVTLHTKGFTFSGELDQERIAQIDQQLDFLSLDDTQGMRVTLQDLVSHYVKTGATLYDMKSSYHLSQLTISKQDLFESIIKDVDANTTQKVTNGLLQTTIQSQVKQVKISTDTEQLLLHTVRWDAMMDNIDIKALEALQQLDPEMEEKAFKQQLKRLLSKGLALKINDLSIKEINQDGAILGGIGMKASLTLDNQVDLSQIEQNPMLLINALDAQSTLRISDKLFALIAQDPRAMMFMMMIPPKEKQGMKVYNLTFSKGQTTVNGMPL